MVSGPISYSAAFSDSGLGCLPKRNRTGTSAPSRGFTRSGPAAVFGGGGGPCREAPGRSADSSRAITPLLRVNSLICTKVLPFPTCPGALCTSLGSFRAACARLPRPSRLLPGYITLPLAVSWFQLHRLRPGTALGGAEELGTQTDSGWRPAGAREISLMGDGVARNPVPPPYISHLPPEILLRREKAQYLSEACQDSVRNVGWEVRAGGGEVEPRDPNPWDWSLTGGRRDKSRSQMLGFCFHLRSFLDSQNS